MDKKKDNMKKDKKNCNLKKKGNRKELQLEKQMMKKGKLYVMELSSSWQCSHGSATLLIPINIYVDAARKLCTSIT